MWSISYNTLRYRLHLLSFSADLRTRKDGHANLISRTGPLPRAEVLRWLIVSESIAGTWFRSWELMHHNQSKGMCCEMKKNTSLLPLSPI
jgi:hypothetical protein